MQDNSKDSKARLPVWFKASLLVLAALIVLKALGLEVFIEIEFNGEPLLASLTELKTYLIPLLLLLAYILLSWLWSIFSDSRDA